MQDRPPPDDRHPPTEAGWQRPSSEVPECMWDVVVVGGGPAGCIAALQLADAGRRVLMLERAAYPRAKACGDLLIPDSIAVLRRVGLYDRVASRAFATGEAVISSPRRIEWSIPGEFLLLRRERFDMLLAEAAHERGATVARGRVEWVRPRANGLVDVAVRARAEPLRARYVVLATGADVSLLDGLAMLEDPAPTAVAVRAYVRSPVRMDELFISFDREILPGYAWAFPLPEGEYNIGVGVLYDADEPARHDLRALYRAFTEAVPAVRAIVEAAEEHEPVRGARLRCGLGGARPCGHGRVLAVGEQIATTYPFTGEGIGKAMETGEMAAAAIGRALETGSEEETASYARQVEEGLRPRYHGYEVAQRWLSRPWLNDLVAWRVRRGRFLREAAAGMVAETVDPRQVFSWRGLMRSVTG